MVPLKRHHGVGKAIPTHASVRLDPGSWNDSTRNAPPDCPHVNADEVVPSHEGVCVTRNGGDHPPPPRSNAAATLTERRFGVS
jgi:hypothetical protein